jgi:hypothetical protein
VVLPKASNGSGNPAQAEAEAILQRMSTLNPQKICEHGDAGRGLDNRQPWLICTWLSTPHQTSRTR